MNYSTENPSPLPVSPHNYSKKKPTNKQGAITKRQKLDANIWNLNTDQVEKNIIIKYSSGHRVQETYNALFATAHEKEAVEALLM